MKLALRRDIDAPAATVYDEIATPEALERLASGRGVHIRRLDDGAGGPAGALWQVRAEIRGRMREGTARIAGYAPGRRLVLDAALDGLSGRATLDFAPLGPARTRLDAALEMGAASMSGRLLLQSLKLARGPIERRLAAHLDQLAGRLERQA